MSGRHVILVGLSGTGKTTVGRILADRLGSPFVDTDAAVEAAMDMTIGAAFESHGERWFRTYEREVICDLLTHGPPKVIAAAAGCVHERVVRMAMRQHLTVWMMAPVWECARRVMAEGDVRPLLRGATLRATATALDVLLSERSGWYDEVSRPEWAPGRSARVWAGGLPDAVADRVMLQVRPPKDEVA